MKFGGLIKEFKEPRQMFMKIIHHYPELFKCMDDEHYLKFFYRIVMGKKLNLDNPQTFNEKLQWLKLYDRKDVYTVMVDKYEAKKYVTEHIGEEYIIPTLGIWNSFDDIDFDSLPNKFVLKCTHDSGGVIICKDKSKFDKNRARNKINRSLKNNFFWFGREWPYKNVRPRIIAEKYMEDSASTDLKDYKLFCFNGTALMTLVCSERFEGKGVKEDFFDDSWNHLEIHRPTHEWGTRRIPCPKQFAKMKELAANLSNNLPFARIDFYTINDRIYFGEITFYPASGFSGFEPEEWDERIGSWIKLPTKSLLSFNM